MAGGYIVCQECKIGVPIKEKLTLKLDVKISESGRKKNNYYHHECYPTFLKKQAVIDNDMKEKDELNDYVKKLYNVPEEYQLPNIFWSFVGDLRNGKNKHQKSWKKRNTKRVPFRVIREAYILIKQDIEWARMSKPRLSEVLAKELVYGLIILQGRLNDAFRKIKTREQQSKINEAMEVANIEQMKEDRVVSYDKKKQENRDYSYLLGDD